MDDIIINARTGNFTKLDASVIDAQSKVKNLFVSHNDKEEPIEKDSSKWNI